MSPGFDENKVFIRSWGEIEGRRIDPNIYKRKFLFVSKFGSKKLSQLAIIDPSINLNNLDSDDEISFIPMDAIDENYGTLKYESKKCVKDVKGFTLFKEGDFLWAKITPCMQNGKSIITKNLIHGIGCGSTEFYVIRPKTNEVLIEYLACILRDSRVLKNAKDYFGGSAGQQRVSRVFFNDLEVPIPSIKVQQNIIAVMQSAYLLKKHKEEQADQLLKSIDDYLLKELDIELPNVDETVLGNRIFYTNSADFLLGRFDPFYNRKTLSWFENKLNKKTSFIIGDVIEYYSGVVYKDDDVTDFGHAILRANNIDLKTNELDLSDIRYINEKILISDDLKLKSGDILMCSASGSKEHAGKVAYITEDTNCYVGGFMSALRTKDSFNSRYIFEYLQSPIFRLLLLRRLGGTNINNVNFQMIKNLPIIMLDKNKQIEITKFIFEIRNNAKVLREEAKKILEDAKMQVERILLGEE